MSYLKFVCRSYNGSKLVEYPETSHERDADAQESVLLRVACLKNRLCGHSQNQYVLIVQDF